MAMKYDDNGNIVEMLNGIKVTYTKEGVIVGEGIEAVLIRGQNLKLSDPANFVQGHYPDNYPFSAPHRHPEEDTYINFSLDPDFPPDGIPLDRLPKVIRELKKIVAGTTSVKTEFSSSVKDGMLVVWDDQTQQYVPASCTSSRADVADGLFFNGVADLDTSSVITSSTVTNESWKLEEGKKYYLDCSNPGMLTTVDTGYFVGIAQGPNTLFLAPLANSAEALITALETGLKALEDRLDKRDESFCSDVASCILGNSGGNEEGPDIPSIGIADEIFKPGGGLTKDPETGKLILDCASVTNCILGLGPDGSGGSGNVGGGTGSEIGGGLAGNLILPGGGLSQDPTTGKIKVDCTGISPCLVNFINSSIKDEEGKFSYGLAYDPQTGKLAVDFNQMPADKMQAVFTSMVQQGGGLSIDPVTGKLIFDSLNMDTTVIENMMKTLRLPIWLDNDLDIYVDKSHALASNTIVEGRGTQNLPFLDIQPAINYVTENFNFGSHTVNIIINDGVYEEALILPDFTATTGILVLKPKNFASTRKVTIKNPSSYAGVTVQVSGSKKYHIHQIAIESIVNPELFSTKRYYQGINVGANADLTLYGNSIEMKMLEGYDSGNFNQTLLMVAGNCTFSLDEELPMRLAVPSTKHNSSSVVLVAASSGQIKMNRSRTDDETRKVYCSGATNCIAQAEIKGSILQSGSGSYVFGWLTEEGKSVTGKRYNCISGGSINTSGQGQDYFPGTVDGTVDSNSYSWYA